MLRPFKYMFYRLYKYYEGSWSDADVTAAQALAGICLPIILNIFSIFSWSDVLVGTKFITTYHTLPKVEIYLLPLIPAFLFSIYWGPKEKYKEIIKEFEKVQETKEQKFRRAIYICTYIICSFLVGAISIFMAIAADKK